ncbi:MAG: hypothetical protein QME13_03405 [Thermoanaerobacteraceae bacterium]|nr:hypothetical protein [Thermoanaerobacteraceae bacterium]
MVLSYCVRARFVGSAVLACSRVGDRLAAEETLVEAAVVAPEDRAV